MDSFHHIAATTLLCRLLVPCESIVVLAFLFTAGGQQTVSQWV
jgi:hypothetical protein